MQIIARNLEPALLWAKEHQAELMACNGEAAVHAFEFRLHQLQFLHCLQSSGKRQSPRLAHARMWIIGRCLQGFMFGPKRQLNGGAI